MILLYFWMNSYGTCNYMNGNGIRLSSKYNIKYNQETHELNIQKNPNDIPGFWGKNITDTCAIVGENGSGKTMLLNYIMDMYSEYNRSENHNNFFAVYEDESEKDLKVFVTTRYDNIKCVGVSATVIQIGIETFEYFKRSSLVYFHNAFSLEDYARKKTENVRDFSLGGMIRNTFVDKFEMHYINSTTNALINYYECESEQIIRFIYQYREVLEIPFHIPQFIEISLSGGRVNLEYIGNRMKNDYGANHVIKDYIDSDEMDKFLLQIRRDYDYRWITELVIHLLVNLFKEICIKQTTGENKLQETMCCIDIYRCKENENKESNLYKFAKKIITQVSKIPSGYYEIQQLVCRKYLDFIDWLEVNNECFTGYNETTLTIPVTDEMEPFMRKLLDFYENTRFAFPYFNFKIGLSTGEYHFISMFSNLSSLLKKENQKEDVYHPGKRYKRKNMILMFDEADLSLHPRWQRNFMKYVTDFVNTVFQDYTIQIIIATHSPIMLSDFLKDSVIYLDKEKGYVGKRNVDTFACNIYSLFLDSFFMDDEDAIGAFAESKINGIADLLLAHKEVDDDSRNLINNIGDDVVRGKLLELCQNSKVESNKNQVVVSSKDTNIDDTIELLQRQIKELQNTVAVLEKMRDGKN